MSDVRPARHVVLAGGGSAGHVEPLLSTADALRRRDPAIGITALGTKEGLESRLVPMRGYELVLVPKVPLPRRPTLDLLRVPRRVRSAVRAAEEHLRAVGASAVVGFGGYVSVPAYLAARRVGVPVVVHEANARPGLANRLGARFAARVATASPEIALRNAIPIGIPLRKAVAELDRSVARGPARAALGLGPGPVLLVTGGSQGARRINEAVCGAAGDLAAAGIQVLHVAGPTQADAVRAALGEDAPPTHHVLAYVDGMETAYAAADLVLCRAGAMTCAELAAVGLPAVYVPLPIGNGEQGLNAQPAVNAGAALLFPDASLTADVVRTTVLPLVRDEQRLAEMSSAARKLGRRDADEALVDLVMELL
ncbi:MAG TPA: undecaprenyldiphospho-muramoylpentapeptide beta-N-acetylglucosaminyltransferase [Mycobacteriales bacterium]|nr:undecaprenyldiphospho-muramoylpentapeptide beta-N-acetylglucosaminyltransferase [Mycobacteriales bacterium]